MAETPMTLQRFFFGRQGPLGFGGRQRLASGKQFPELQEALREQLGKVKWKVVARELVRRLGELLDVRVADTVMAPAWQRWKELQKYRDPEQCPPGESAIVPLAEHSIESTHSPHIDLLVRDVEIGRLDVQLALALQLEGVVLRIHDGRIWQIEAGGASGSGKLSCSFRDRQIYAIERASKRFRLAGGLGFEDGLEIPPLPSAVYEEG